MPAGLVADGVTANAGELFVADDRGLIGSNYIVTAVTADDYQVDPRAITISVPQSIRRDETLTLTANTALDEVTLTGGTLASGERLGLYFDGVMIGEMVRVEDPPGSGSFVLRPTASTTATVQQIVDARQGTGLLQVASFDANGAILPDFARRYAVTFADGRQTSDLQGTFGVFDAGLGDITFTITTATSDLFLDPPEAPAPLVIRDSSGSQPMTAVLYNELFSDTASPAMTRFLQDKADAIDGAVGAGSLLSRTLRDYANGTITGTRFNEIVGAERDGMGTIVGLMGDFALSLASLGPDEITEAERQLLLRLNLRTRELGYEFADSLRANIEADTARRTMQNSTLVGVFSAARFGDPLGDTISGFSEAHAAGMVAALNPDGDAVAVAAATGIGVFTGVAARGHGRVRRRHCRACDGDIRGGSQGGERCCGQCLGSCNCRLERAGYPDEWRRDPCDERSFCRNERCRGGCRRRRRYLRRRGRHHHRRSRAASPGRRA